MVTTRKSTQKSPPRIRRPTAKASKTAPTPPLPTRQAKSKKQPRPKAKSKRKAPVKEATVDIIEIETSPDTPSPRPSQLIEVPSSIKKPPPAPPFIVLISFEVTIDGSREYGVGFDIDLSDANRAGWDYISTEVTARFMEIIKGRVF